MTAMTGTPEQSEVIFGTWYTGPDLFSYLYIFLFAIGYKTTKQPQFACYLTHSPCAMSEVHSGPSCIWLDYTNDRRRTDQVWRSHSLLYLRTFTRFVRVSLTWKFIQEQVQISA